MPTTTSSCSSSSCSSLPEWKLPGHLQPLFDDALELVRWEFPGSHPVIGGGAIRDALLGRPIKDIDVFMRSIDHNELDSELTVKVKQPAFLALYGRKDMHGAWDFLQDVQGLPVQLILADFMTPQELADSFDLNLSRATYDGYSLHVSAAFEEGVWDKAFRILRCESDLEERRSFKRVSRLQEKYPEYIHDETTLEQIRGH